MIWHFLTGSHVFSTKSVTPEAVWSRGTLISRPESPTSSKMANDVEFVVCWNWSDAEQVEAHPLTYPSLLVPEVILTLDVTQCCEFKQVTEYLLRLQSLKECVLRHPYSRNRTEQNQFVSHSTAHCSVVLIIRTIILIILIIRIIIRSGSYYAFRVRLNAFPKISEIKLVRP